MVFEQDQGVIYWTLSVYLGTDRQVSRYGRVSRLESPKQIEGHGDRGERNCESRAESWKIMECVCLFRIEALPPQLRPFTVVSQRLPLSGMAGLL